MGIKKSRRGFLRQAGLMSGIFAAGKALGENVGIFSQKNPGFSAADKISVGVIGLGLMGFGDLETALKIQGVFVGGVCDLYEGHLDRAKEIWGKDLYTTRDFRELLERKEIDAVIVATPDHWHAPISIAAMRAGKHVYCEKPMVQKIESGLEVVQVQKETGKVFTVGSQGVSSVATIEAAKLIESGAIGEINCIQASHDSYHTMGAWNYSIPTDASPQTVDWDRFLGSAPKRAYDPVRFFRWRNYSDYGTGVAGDIFIHKISAIHRAINSMGPESIYATGQLSFWKDGRDARDVMTAIMQYPALHGHPPFQTELRVNLANGGGGSSDLKIVGTEGSIELRGNTMLMRNQKLPKAPGYGGWDGYNVFSSRQQKAFLKWYNEKYSTADQAKIPATEKRFAAPAGYDDRLDHFRYFFESIRGGKPVVEDAVFGLRAAGACLACNLSADQGKVIRWDAEKMMVV
ncbi:Gfo/Idh/MocA family oxidoreductase [Pollutibacter soli]|uniref:Gfo/Idh/MocA family protein n=1 Tax=Pollutibacter soli TaxID=3034157 RepID=UPI0030139352